MPLGEEAPQVQDDAVADQRPADIGDRGLKAIEIVGEWEPENDGRNRADGNHDRDLAPFGVAPEDE